MREYTETELIAMGMDEAQINAVLSTQRAKAADEQLQNKLENEQIAEGQDLPFPAGSKIVQMHQHNVDVHVDKIPLVPTTIDQLALYKNGTVVELPPFAEGQPFVARMVRPSMLALVKSGKIPNSLLNQATSLFANGTGALNTGGKNATNVSELFDVIDVIVNAALLEPNLTEIRAAGMELTDDQLMAIFSYTQRGIKALESFRTE
ncbi:MAG: hypothetical protein K2N34_05645 [Lachnospiraceae bacterium]|nr:hypothetical protein [Lachnospiraceae bacterium]